MALRFGIFLVASDHVNGETLTDGLAILSMEGAFSYDIYFSSAFLTARPISSME